MGAGEAWSCNAESFALHMLPCKRGCKRGFRETLMQSTIKPIQMAESFRP